MRLFIMKVWTFLIMILSASLAQGACPNYWFKKNHVCHSCPDEQSALAVTKDRTNPPGLNTVIYVSNASTMRDQDYWEEQGDIEDYCGITVKVDIMWQCRIIRNPEDGTISQEYCNKDQRYSNKVCTIYHGSANGHLFYNYITCQ